MSIARTFHTVRYLRPVQIVDRVRRRILPLRSIPVLDGDIALALRRAVPPARLDSAGFDGGSFRFLNQRHRFEGERRWRPEGASRLWTYNLHYFEYLWAIGAADALRLMQDWVALNTDPASAGWEPYTLSLRIREWIEWLHANQDLPPAIREKLAGSIAAQAEALSRQVEWHLLGNHIAENAITLAWAGLSFEGPRADRWLGFGLRLLRDEVEPQVLDDAVHEERSPMYQAQLAHGLLRLGEAAGLSNRPRAAEVARLASALGGWLLAGLERLVHPDGDYALLNDCAFGVAPTLAQLHSRFPGSKPSAGHAPRAGRSSGYCSGRSGANFVLFDGGPPGPDHQMGHGHADNLAFELSVGGRRLVTDTGAGSYEIGPVRAYDRSTSAHNTVQVDGRDQSEVWAAFRCARRAVSHPAVVRDDAAHGYEAEGMYRSSFGRGVVIEHGRSLRLTRSGLEVTDALTAAGEHTARVRLHLAPGIELRGGGGRWDILDGSRRLASVNSKGLIWQRSGSPYHPEFGLEFERQCLSAAVRFRNGVKTGFSILVG